MRFPLALAVLLIPPTASGFTVYRSDNGAPLRWFQRDVLVTIDTDPPQTVPPVAANEAVQEGYLAWSNLACAGEAVPFSFAFQVGDGVVGYDDGAGPAGNTNLVVWISEAGAWPHESNVTGLTTLTFDTVTGQIVDADMELNEVDFRFSLTGEPVRADVLNTVVHETGHVLGLDHSQVQDSTMYATADLGEVKKRTLHADDLQGYCALYGPGALPRPDPNGNGSAGGGCATGGSPSPAPATLWLVALLLLGLRLNR